MNTLAYVYDRLTHFGADQTLVLQLLATRGYRSSAEYIKGLVAEMILMVDENTDAYDKKIIIDTLKKLEFLGETPKLFMVSQGTSFCLEVDLEEGRDFTGFNLVARHAKDGTLLSDPTHEGTNLDLQEVEITNIQLAEGAFYKINVLLEAPDAQGVASGDAVAKLTDVVVIVTDNIDS